MKPSSEHKVSIRRLLWTIVIAVCLAYAAANAQKVTKTGTTAAKFLSVGIGPRANAMGGAFSAVADDASSVRWNPAGIAYSDDYQAMFTYSTLFADIKLSYLGLIIPGGNTGNFAASVTALDYGKIEVTTESQPDGSGETYSPGSYAIGISYARSITDDFMVGATSKLVTESIYHSSATGIAFDIGTMFKTPFYGVKFASSITNFGTKMQMGGDDLLTRYDVDPQRAGSSKTIDANIATDRFDMPLRLQIGISREFVPAESQRLILAVDGIVPNDNNQSVNIGGELSMFDDLISLRGGYKALFLKDSQEGLTLGVGVRYKEFELFSIGVDYAYQKYTYLGNVQSFGIQMRF